MPDFFLAPQKDMDGSKDLQRQVLGYYQYLWVRQKGRSLSDIYDLLPTVFQAEVTYLAYIKLIQKASCDTLILSATQLAKFQNIPLLIFFCCCLIGIRQFLAINTVQANIFEGADKGFLRAISRRIKTALFLPGQIIVTRGDIGHQMYFVHKGDVEVRIEHIF